MGNNLEEAIRRIVAKQLDVSDEQVTMEARFIDDLGADSLDIVEFIMTLEEEFETEISDEEAEKIVTVGDAVAYVQEKKK